MKRLANLEDLNAELVNLICFLVGIVLIAAGIIVDYYHKNLGVILISVGSSMVASTVIIYLSSKYLMRKRQIQDLIDNWGLIGIFKTRAEMNVRANITFEDVKKELDMIAFGLRAFRNAKGHEIEEKVRQGLRIRILTINPYSPYVAQRERDENEVRGQITKTILDLHEWIKKLKTLSSNKDNIQIKFCDNLTIESYYRQDDYIYTGPYLYGKPSQQTISYEYKRDSIGFEYWIRYFQNLWDDPAFARMDYKEFNKTTKEIH